MQVFLVGAKGSGKSVVGRRLAEALHRSFRDVDTVVEDLYEERATQRLVVREIYRLDDGTSFRALEAAACRRLAESAERLVVATGGGVCDNPDAARALAAGLVVHLQGDADLLFDRIIRNGIPAFIASSTPEEAREEYRAIHRARSARYREMAQITVEIGGSPVSEIVDILQAEIEEWFRGR
jgi:shikimate kinase